MIREILSKYTIVDQDLDRPWGGFYCIHKDQASQFTEEFFPEVHLKTHLPISPKILVIASKQRISWQYHHRREEVWSILLGPVGIIRSPTNEMGELQTLNTGDIVFIKCGERHRLVGLDQTAIVAELWRHTDVLCPSDEQDIVRVQDDYRRF